MIYLDTRIWGRGAVLGGNVNGTSFSVYGFTFFQKWRFNGSEITPDIFPVKRQRVTLDSVHLTGFFGAKSYGTTV